MFVSMKRLGGLAAVMGLALSVTACQGVASTETESGAASWQGANYMPEQNSFSRAIDNVADYLGESGVAEVEMFHQEALLGAEDILPGVADGRADIGMINPFYYPGELPLTNVASVPFVSQDPWAHTTALNEMYESNEALQAEYEKAGIELLTFAPVSTTILGARDPIDSVEDLEGMKIRSVGLMSDALSAAGVNPISMPAGEIYQSMEQGVIDGYTSYPFDISVQNSYQEVAPSVLDPGTGVYSVGAILMNKSNWESLSDEQRAEIEANRRAFADTAGEMVADDLKAECDAFLETEGTLTKLPDEEIEKLEEASGDALVEAWRSDAVATGLDEADVDAYFDEFTAALETHEAASEMDLSVQPCIDEAA